MSCGFWDAGAIPRASLIYWSALAGPMTLQSAFKSIRARQLVRRRFAFGDE
jgi:hypothetical protein